MDYHRDLYKSYTKIRPFFERLIEKNEFSENYMSDFWKKRLDSRENFPNFNELVVFRRDHAASIGYDKNNTVEKEIINFQINYDRAIFAVPENFILDNQESLVGNPFVFSKGKVLSSSAGLNNTVSAYWALSALSNRIEDSDLENVLEIGAGYGGVAELIIRNKKPKCYVLCDLPHNLYLTAFYLSANHPEYRICFSSDLKSTGQDDYKIILCTPEDIEKINLNYDFILNTYSFQEMRKKDVHFYFNYISKKISDRGLFYFLNTFGAAGADSPSDYPFHKFRVLSWGPANTTQPNFFLKRQHAECVMAKKSKEQNFEYFNDISYQIHLLFFSGVGNHLKAVCENLYNDKIEENDIRYFHLLNNVLMAKSPSIALRHIDALSDFHKWKMITLYLKGILFILNGNIENCKQAFRVAIDEGLTGLAKSRTLLALSITAYRSNDSKRAQNFIDIAIKNTPQYAVQLQNIDQNFKFNDFGNLYKFIFPNMNIFNKTNFFKRFLKI